MSLSEESQTLEGHVLTAAAAEQLGRNLQREDQLIFTLLHTFWEVSGCAYFGYKLPTGDLQDGSLLHTCRMAA